MKRILILLLLPTVASAQFSLGMSLGTSNAAMFATEFQLAYSHNWVIQTGYSSLVSRKVEKPSVFYIRTGYEFTGEVIDVVPAIGYGYHLHSTDNKALNSHRFMYSVQLERQMREGKLYFTTSYTNRIFVAGIGIKYVF